MDYTVTIDVLGFARMQTGVLVRLYSKVMSEYYACENPNALYSMQARADTYETAFSVALMGTLDRGYAGLFAPELILSGIAENVHDLCRRENRKTTAEDIRKAIMVKVDEAFNAW